MTPSRENIELSVARSTLSIFMTMAGAVYLLDWISPGMAGAHEIYRCSTLGVALVDALEELINDQELSDKMAMQVLAQFDTSMGTLLGNNLRNKGTIKVPSVSLLIFPRDRYGRIDFWTTFGHLMYEMESSHRTASIYLSAKQRSSPAMLSDQRPSKSFFTARPLSVSANSMP